MCDVIETHFLIFQKLRKVLVLIAFFVKLFRSRASLYFVFCIFKIIFKKNAPVLRSYPSQIVLLHKLVQVCTQCF